MQYWCFSGLTPWTPYGLHMDSTWTPYGLAPWTPAWIYYIPYGLHMESMWSPYGITRGVSRPLQRYYLSHLPSVFSFPVVRRQLCKQNFLYLYLELAQPLR